MKAWTGACAVCIVSQHLETELTFVHIMLSCWIAQLLLNCWLKGPTFRCMYYNHTTNE